MYIKAKYNNLIRPYMRIEKQGFGSLYGGNQISNVLIAEDDFLGEELITNVALDEDNNWILPNGVTHNSEGYLDFDGTQGNGITINTPEIDFKLGSTYRVSYEIKNYVSGTIKFRFQNGINTIGKQQNSNGIKTEVIECKDENNKKFQFFQSSSFIGSIDNISVREVQTRTNERTIENENESSTMFVGDRVFSYTNLNTGQQLIFTNQSVFIIDNSSSTITEIDTYRALQFINDSEWVKDVEPIIVDNNLLENGDFSDFESGWNFSNGWTYSNEEAIFEDTVTSYLISNTTLTSGVDYKLEFDVEEITGQAKIAFYVGGGQVSPFINYSTGNYTLNFNSPNNSEFRVRAASSGHSFSIDNIKLTEI